MIIILTILFLIGIALIIIGVRYPDNEHSLGARWLGTLTVMNCLAGMILNYLGEIKTLIEAMPGVM